MRFGQFLVAVFCFTSGFSSWAQVSNSSGSNEEGVFEPIGQCKGASISIKMSQVFRGDFGSGSQGPARIVISTLDHQTQTYEYFNSILTFDGLFQNGLVLHPDGSISFDPFQMIGPDKLSQGDKLFKLDNPRARTANAYLQVGDKVVSLDCRSINYVTIGW